MIYSAQVRAQKWATSVMGLIPGPEEMKNMDCVLQLFVDELQAARVNGIQVVLPNGDTKIHYVLVSAVFGDEPASKKISHWKQHGAYLGCGYCDMRGEWHKAMRYPPFATHGFYLKPSE